MARKSCLVWSEPRASLLLPQSQIQRQATTNMPPSPLKMVQGFFTVASGFLHGVSEFGQTVEGCRDGPTECPLAALSRFLAEFGRRKGGSAKAARQEPERVGSATPLHRSQYQESAAVTSTGGRKPICVTCCGPPHLRRNRTSANLLRTHRPKYRTAQGTQHALPPLQARQAKFRG